MIFCLTFFQSASLGAGTNWMVKRKGKFVTSQYIDKGINRPCANPTRQPLSSQQPLASAAAIDPLSFVSVYLGQTKKTHFLVAAEELVERRDE
jgi:hypothetical protein